jgi:ADP-ribose pyrophosphatase
MTNANMKLVTVSVWLEDELQHPQPNLEPGEYIVTKVVPLAELHDTLEEYSKNGCMVDARLSHFAVGYQFAQKIKDDALP